MKENQRAKHQKDRNRKIRKLVKLQINHGTEKTRNRMIERKNERVQTNEQRKNKRTKKENKLTKKEMKQKIVRHF